LTHLLFEELGLLRGVGVVAGHLSQCRLRILQLLCSALGGLCPCGKLFVFGELGSHGVLDAVFDGLAGLAGLFEGVGLGLQASLQRGNLASPLASLSVEFGLVSTCTCIHTEIHTEIHC